MPEAFNLPMSVWTAAALASGDAVKTARFREKAAKVAHALTKEQRVEMDELLRWLTQELAAPLVEDGGPNAQ